MKKKIIKDIIYTTAAVLVAISLFTSSSLIHKSKCYPHNITVFDYKTKKTKIGVLHKYWNQEDYMWKSVTPDSCPICIKEKLLKIGIDMDDKYDILDVLFVVEALTAGYLIYLLWGTV